MLHIQAAVRMACIVMMLTAAVQAPENAAAQLARGPGTMDPGLESGEPGRVLHSAQASGKDSAVILLAPGDDCNRNGIPDAEDLAANYSADCNDNGVPDECDLEDATPQPADWHSTVLHGVAPTEAVGYNVAAAGDVNGDGVADLILGSGRYSLCFENAADGGDSYVVFGGPDFPGGDFDLADLDGSNGFVITRPDPDGPGPSAVAGIGDLNDDGVGDLLICLPETHSAELGNAGACYLVFGGPGVGAGGVVDLAGLDGTNGATIANDVSDEYLGWYIAAAGDVNQDGADDALIGTLSGMAAYLLFGGAGEWPANISLALLGGSAGPNGARGVRLLIDDDTQLGRVVAGAGDFDGDGFADFAVGAPAALEGRGLTALVFGRATPWPATLNLDRAVPGSFSFIIGPKEQALSHMSLAGVGDVNDDGPQDLVITTASISSKSHVLYGRTTVPSEIHLDDDGVVRITELTGEYMVTVAAAGDLDGDHTNDMVFGQSRLVGPPGPLDQSFIVYGRQYLEAAATLDLAELQGLNGYAVQGLREQDRLGNDVAGVGDVNGDGLDDMLLGAVGLGTPPDDACQAGPGGAYVIFGRERLDLDADGDADLCLTCPVPLSSDPPDGAIDARQPLDPDCKAVCASPGWSSLTLTYPHWAAAFSATQFEIEVIGGPEREIAAIVPDGSEVVVQLNDRIPVGAWTLWSQPCDDTRVRLGFLPADANNDGSSTALDILALIDALNAASPLPDHAADINRDDAQSPADILRLIDLLNGAGDFEAYYGATLPRP